MAICRKEDKIKRFRKTYIEITNECNMACDFCPGTKRNREYMSVDLFETVLKKIKGHSENLYFHVMGEPLLHPDIGLFLDMCAEHGYRVNLTTNGTLPEKLMELTEKTALRQVSFSLHSFEGNRIDVTESYMSAIFEFIEAVNDKNISISLRLWNLKTGKDNENNAAIIDVIKKKTGYESAIDNSVTPVNGIKIGKKIFLKQAENFEWPCMHNPEIGNKGFCIALREQIAILVDGSVVPCCLDAEGVIGLGNIKNSSIQDIFDSERAKNIYNGFSHRIVVEPLCRRCSFRKRFDK